MTDPQPYTREELDGLPEALLFVPSLFVDKDERARLAATLRDYQRVLAENAALREDARRWRAVRDDLAVERESAVIGGVECQYWRIVGNNYDLYPGPFPATLEEAADRLIDAARSGGEEKHD